ncbi:MAG: hypothetical protein WC243_04540 [Patescibacteria group bacterium]|jgi:hypothetical protein
MNPNQTAQSIAPEPLQVPQTQNPAPSVTPTPQTGSISSESPVSDTAPTEPISTFVGPPKEFVPSAPEKPKKGFNPVFVLVPLFVILGLVVGSAFFVVYGQASFIPFEVKMAVSSIVLRIPFLPKTTEYVLLSAANANKSIKSGSIDASLALSSQVIAEVMETTDLDLTVKGAFDFKDEANSMSDLNFKYGEYVDFNLLTLPKNSFFRINRVDPQILSFLATLEEEDLSSLMNVWVKTERSMASSAREKLEDEKAKSQIDDLPREDLIAFFKEDMLPRMQMTTETGESSGSYRMKLDIDQDLLQKFISRLGSEGVTEAEDINNDLRIENGQLEILVDSKSYYIDQLSLNLVFVPTIPTISFPESEGTTNVLGDSTPTEVRIAFVVNLSDHGASLALQEPDQSITIDEYVERLTDVYTKLLEGMYGDETLDGSELPSEEPLVTEEIDETVPGEENTPFGRMLP